MPKKTAGRTKHQSFKLSPHKHPQERVLIYIVVAVVVGVAIGWLLKDDFVKVIYGSSMMGY